MTALDALRAGLRTLGSHPAGIMPYYMLAIGATVIARTPLMLGGGLVLLVLRLQGRLEPVVRMLDELDPTLEEGTLTQTQQAALAELITPTGVLVVLLATLTSVVLYVLCRSAASAGTIHALFAPLDGRDPLSAGAAGISRDWTSFVAIGVARFVVYLVGAVALVLGLGLSATGIGLVVGLPLVLASVAGLLFGHLLLAFAGQAVVVSDRRALGAIADSARFPVRAPTAFVLYVVVGLCAVIGLGIAAPLMAVAGVSRIAALVLALGLALALDAAKTGLYAGESARIGGPGLESRPERRSNRTDRVADGGRPDDDPDQRDITIDESGNTTDEGGNTIDRSDDTIDRSNGTIEQRRIEADETGMEAVADESEVARERPRSVPSRLLAGQRRGLGALAAFLRAHPLANIGGMALFLIGTGLGWLLTRPYGTRLSGPENVAGVFGEFAVGPFVNIAANNWYVAIGQGFGGLAFGVPAIVNLLFNGVLVGGLAGIFETVVFLALVAPHGIVEVPALAISGGVGLYLGGVGYQWARGRIDAAAVGHHLQQATWVLVGLLPLFVLAAFVEAFLTPWIAAVVLG